MSPALRRRFATYRASDDISRRLAGQFQDADRSAHCLLTLNDHVQPQDHSSLTVLASLNSPSGANTGTEEQPNVAARLDHKGIP